MQSIGGFNNPEEAVHFGEAQAPLNVVRDELSESPLAMISDQQQMVAVAEAPYPWILSPSLDLLFACGGLLWFTTMAVDRLGWTVTLSTPQGALMWCFWIFGIHCLANPHASFGWHRVVTSPFVPQKTKRFLGLFGLVCLVATIPLAFNAGLTGIAVRIYLPWLLFHYVAQAFGISMIYCIKRGYKMNKLEKDLMRWMFNLFALTICSRAFTDETYAGKLFFGISVPFWGVVPPWLYQCVLYSFIASALAFAAMVIMKYFTQKQLFPLPALFNAVSLMAILTMTPKTNDPSLGIFFAAFYHGSQNIVIATACHLKERGLPVGMKNAQIMRQFCTKYTLTYLLAMVVFGFLVNLVLPRIIAIFTHELQLAVIAVVCTASFHHFITEGIVWKLRDPAARKIIVA